MIKRLKKTLKIIGLGILSIILLLAITAVLFVNLSPEFGGDHNEDDIERYRQSKHYEDGKFQNLIPTSMDMSFSQMLKVLGDMIEGTPDSRPDFELPMEKVDSLNLVNNRSTSKIIWFGHSAFLLQMDGLNILMDPMFGDVCAPHPWLGQKRYSSKLPIEIEELPIIDLIIISHDHYDHLDYGSIQKVKDKTKAFFVPLGVGAHFEEWGVPANQIHELNWWDEVQHRGLTLAFTPSRHFSGRGISNRFSTLWGSWVVKSKTENVFFSGDSGYGPHFLEIGDRFGPFDFAMIECGQYNEQWKEIHMMPEESAQAAVDLNAKVMMPIHWGAFTLALHSWTDPIERVSVAAEKLAMPLIAPVIGEQLELKSIFGYTNTNWWKK